MSIICGDRYPHSMIKPFGSLADWPETGSERPFPLQKCRTGSRESFRVSEENPSHIRRKIWIGTSSFALRGLLDFEVRGGVKR